MKPLYQALICCFVKFVLSMRNCMSSLGSFLLPATPIPASSCLHHHHQHQQQQCPSADWSRQMSSRVANDLHGDQHQHDEYSTSRSRLHNKHNTHTHRRYQRHRVYAFHTRGLLLHVPYDTRSVCLSVCSIHRWASQNGRTYPRVGPKVKPCIIRCSRWRQLANTVTRFMSAAMQTIVELL